MGSEAAVRAGSIGPLCPTGHGGLEPVDLGIIRLARCGRCQGLWAERAVLDRLRHERDARAAACGADRPAPASPEGQYRPCPVCARLMDRVRYGPYKVEVDLCVAHGAWFDSGELGRVAWHLRPAPVATAVAPADMRTWEIADLDLELLVDLISALLED